jgi:DHA2 family multidrug resistance protein
MASSMMSIIQQVGGAIGIAVLSTVLDNRNKFHMSTVGPAFNSSSPAFMETMRAIAARAHDLGLSHLNSAMAAKAALIKYIYIAQMNFAFQDAFFFAMVLILISLIPTILLPNYNVVHHSHDTVIAE